MVQSLDSRGWSLARQLVVLQVCVVVFTVGIEAMAGLYRTSGGIDGTQRQVLGLIALTEVALTFGIAGSLLLAGRVRRQTFDLEPAEIARQYQHHHAMLHAVREGLIITDRGGTLMLANDEARRLLRLPGDCEGAPLVGLLAGSELADLVTGQDTVQDRQYVAAGRVLVVGQRQAEVNGTPIGTVTTLRDRTELHQALDELDAVRKLADTLRRQAHEFANRMQNVVGFIELQEYDKAIRLGTQEAARPQQFVDGLRDRAGHPDLAALLLGKTIVADERGVELRMDVHGNGTTPHLPMPETLTVLGNLLDNAIDAAATRQHGWIELTIRAGTGTALQVTVRDNGPGITADPPESVFAFGYTTKESDRPGGRGLGLAQVRDTVARLGGTVTVHNDGGAVFQVRLPTAAAAAEHSAEWKS